MTAFPASVAPRSSADDVAAAAANVARERAAQAGVEVRLAETQREARQAAEVLGKIWTKQDRLLPLTPELAWALAHAGNYVATAQRDGVVVGAAVAFRGRDAHGVHLHSHITGIVPDQQGGSVGFALKQHQRAWALEQGIDRITWTFDPLVARNAYFNVVKLGATVTRYYEDFYGPLYDGINAGDESDRCLVSWQLDGERAEAAAAGEVPTLPGDELREQGAVDVLVEDETGEPIVVSADVNGAALWLCQLPRDIVALRASAPPLARRWRHAVREVLAPALNNGASLTSVTREGIFVVDGA